MPQVFDAEDFLDIPEDADSSSGKIKEAPKEEVKQGPKKLTVPDDFADASLRGKTVEDLALELTSARADAAAARKLAQDTSTAIASALTTPAKSDESPDYYFTDEDLLTNSAAVLNAKLDKMFAAKATPLQLENYQILSQQAYAVARGDSQNMPFFGEYEGEILALAGKTHVQLTARLGTWYELYNRVTSSHQSEITEKLVRKRLEAERGSIRPAPDGERGRASTVSTNGKDELSDREKLVANALGVSHADYATNKARMNG